MAIQLPRVLKNFNLYPDGMSFAGRCDEATPPKLALIMESHRAGGMDAGKKLDLGMEDLTLVASISDASPELMNLLGVEGKTYILRKAVQAQGQKVEPVMITMRGMMSAWEEAPTKPGTKSVHTATFELDLFKYRQKDVDHIEIDIINMVRRIGGVDQLQDQRNAI